MDNLTVDSEEELVRPSQAIGRSTRYVCRMETPNGPRIIARPARDHEMRLVEAVRRNLVAGIDVSITHVTEESIRGTHIPGALESYDLAWRELKIFQKKVVPDAEVEAYKLELVKLQERVRYIEESIFVQFVVLVKIGAIYRKVEVPAQTYDKQCQRMNILRKKMPAETHWEVSVVPEHLVTEVPFVSEPVLREDGLVEHYLDQHLGADTIWYSPEHSEGRKQFRHLLEDGRKRYDLTLEQTKRLKDVLNCLLDKLLSESKESDMRAIQGRLSNLIVRLEGIIWDKSDKGESQRQW